MAVTHVSPKLEKFAFFLLVICAFTLQIQVTLFSSDDYLGLRINATDLLVPFTGLAILVSLLCKCSRWPVWHLNHFYIWLAGLTAILLFSLAIGYLHFGQISHWALVNKIGGWIILLALLGMGGWLACNVPSSGNIHTFLNLMALFITATLSVEFLLFLFQDLTVIQNLATTYSLSFRQIEGFMANRNSYALLFQTVLFFITALYLNHDNTLSRILSLTLCFYLPFFVIFDGSRAMILSLGLLFPLFLILHYKQPKKLLPLLAAILAGVLFVGVAFHDKASTTNIYLLTKIYKETNKNDISEQQSDTFSTLPSQIPYIGDRMRIMVLNDAMEQIKEHPLLGSGLGSAMMYQQQKHGEALNVIDSTPIWIYVEMGIAGLLAFAGFFFLTFTALWKRYKTTDGIERAILLGTLFTLAGFAVMCLFHEILYTRHMWFLTGLALALPLRTHRPE